MLEVYEEFVRSVPFAEIEETALPSYTHKNSLIRRIFWGRVWAIVQAVESLSPTDVLDFGCGGACVTALLQSTIRRSVFDVYYKPFDYIRSRVDQLAGVRQINGKDLERVESEFDVIIAADVLEHMDEMSLNIQLHSFGKWLRAKGYIVVCGPTENSLYRIGRRMAGFSGKYHQRNIHAIRQAIVDSGMFELARIKRYPIPFFAEGFQILTYKKTDH